MINLTNLFEYVQNYVDNNSTIIYIGVGTHFNGSMDPIHKREWDIRENQQFPPFLQDAKKKYFDKKILLILIDPAFKETSIPYIVSTSNSFLENSWKDNQSDSNIFESDLGVDVIILNKSITWGSYKEYEYDKESYDIFDLMIKLCKLISNPQIDSLLFYHEFTGKNPILLEYLIKSHFNYDDTKICIDISRGADLSCYFNLTEPENYPLISNENLNNKLKYINPIKISNNKIKQLYNQYYKFTWNKEKCTMSKTETNILIDKPEDMILCFQILKFDNNFLNIIKDSIITMIRQFYTMNEKKNFGSKMWGV